MVLFPLLQACPLNPNPQPLTGQQELLQDFSKRFSPAIRGVVEFAKRIPGFSLLTQDDQVTLLKAGVFEVLLVRLACMFDAQTSTMICLNGQLLKRDAIHNSSNARFLMDSMFSFAEQVNSLRLSDAEIGLFCSIVVIAADRPGLRNTDLIEKMHNKLKNALQMVMAQSRPGHPDLCHELMKKIPDLRTLNTLHSEKLLAFKMSEQQQLAQQHQSWTHEDEGISKSPAGSSWSSSSDVTMDEAKSPLGSVSSTESMCSSEVVSLTDYHTSQLHPNHPSLHSQHSQNHHHQSQISQHASSAPLLAATLAGGFCPHRNRANSGSTSSGDDELANAAHLVHNGLTITPVLRTGTLPSASPHHRYGRKLDSPSDSGIESGTEKLDSKLTSSSAPTSLCSSPRSSLEDHSEDKSHIVEDMPVLKRVLQAPPLYDTNSLMDEAYKPHKKFRALRNKDSEAEPSCSTPHVIAGPSHQTPTITHNNNGSLSSTHSTLARSLMEGPRMTAEQQKRTDIIHNYIMRGESNTENVQYTQCPFRKSPSSSTITSNSGPLLVCATPTYGVPQYSQNNWTTNAPTSYGTSVITTTSKRQSPTPTYVLVPNSTSRTPPPKEQNDYPRIYFHPQSPQSTCVSPPVKNTETSPCTSSSGKMVELQVDIAQGDAPLNLSKKSPTPSPRNTPTLKTVTMEA